eukprot:505493_1
MHWIWYRVRCIITLYLHEILPPGPIGLPFIGSLLSMAGAPQSFFNHVSMTYGPICYFKMALTDIVVINDSNLARKILENKLIMNRPNVFEIFNPWKSFLFLEANKQWILRRKYAQSILIRMCTSDYLNNVIQNTM